MSSSKTNPDLRLGKWVREDKPHTIFRRTIYVYRWRAPYNLRKGGLNTPVLTFSEAEDELDAARIARARKYSKSKAKKLEVAQRLRRYFQHNDAVHNQQCADFERRQAVLAFLSPDFA